MIMRDEGERFAAECGYTGVQESLYTAEHPEVVLWTNFFQNRFRSLQIFERFMESTGASDIHKAKAVGTQWYRFSSFMPWFLCRAASMVSDNIKRHYVIQTAFEELGMRDVNEIHPEMFKQATECAQLTYQDFEALKSYDLVTKVLDWLANALLHSTSDAHVMGMLLGLEGPAEENIDTLFGSLAYTGEIEEELMKTKFFRLHRAIECEHVRLTISNFLRFNTDEESKNAFITGFDDGIQFWENYWNSVSQLTESLRKEGQISLDAA